ncbi:MAG: ABC transporter ATP-binding protein [Acidobacteria bacterium]|nr:MAG: ABC transporter ATP-binding protein [Acidobacteriota bacterium]
MTAPLLEVRGLVKHFPVQGGWWGPRALVRAVDGVDLDVGRGEIVGLVGESGSGKTTLGRAVLRLLEPTAGSVRFDGIDLLALRPRELRRLRRRLQIVFQDASTALNPRMRVRSLVGEPLVIHGMARGRELTERVVALLEEVGLDAGALDRYPHEFSGGQRQRIGIARALAVRPEFVVLDEPVSALDVSVQAQIVNLLLELQEKHRMAYLFISHDLALIGHLCDRIAVMYLGRIVEEARAAALLRAPRHPYTRALFAAVPPPDPERARRLRAPLPGEMPSPVDLPPGCRFHPRCPHAEAACRDRDPELREIGAGHRVACHLAETLPETPPVARPATSGPSAERTAQEGEVQ